MQRIDKWFGRVFMAALAVAFVAGLVYAANGPQPSAGLYWYDSADPTVAPGMAAPLNQLLVRTDQPSIYYKSGAGNTNWTQIGNTTGGGGTVSSVACGTGVACSPNPITTVGSITANLAGASCAAGQAVRAISASGAGTCAAFGSVTSITCNSGLTCTPNPIVGTGTIAPNLAGASCAAGTAVTAISSAGAGTCTAVGTVTSGTLTANTLPKASSASNLVNSSTTDDGTTWAVNSTALTVDEASGNTSIGGTFTTGNTVTTTDTGTQNNYSPTGIANATILRLNPGSALTITGITGGVNGRHLIIENVSGTAAVTLANENASSTAANRLNMLGATGTVMSSNVNTAVHLVYDGTASRWKPISTMITSYNAQITFVGGAVASGGVTVSGSNLVLSTATGVVSTVGGTAPTLSSCGGSPTVQGSDIAGRVTTGTTNTGCVVTFAATYTNPPSCVVMQENTTDSTFKYSLSATAITVTYASNSNNVFDYHCIKVQ